MNFAKHLLPGALLAFATLQAASAGELPTYEASSVPATPVQLSVLGASRAQAQEQSPAATLTRDGMPATPVQLSVLAPHHRRSAAAETTTTVGAARN
jgi:hypothetical protein